MSIPSGDNPAREHACRPFYFCYHEAAPKKGTDPLSHVLRWADRLLFGTDVLMSKQEIPQFALYDSLDLPEEMQYKIYRGNAIKLQRLEGK